MTDGKSEMDRSNERRGPAPLRGEAVLSVQTWQAQRLVNGRKGRDGKPAIVGLTGFAHRTQLVWQAAQEDDPYADWFLIRIEDALDEAKMEVRRQEETVREVLTVMDGIRLEVAESVQPGEVPLRFPNPYGYMGAYLLADFDRLTRTILSARHFALLDRDRMAAILNGTGRRIRSTFILPMGWRHTGVVRKDLAQMNQLAARAIEAMGKPPQEVIERKRRARHAPPIREASWTEAAENEDMRDVEEAKDPDQADGEIETEDSEEPERGATWKEKLFK
ncbi:PFL_4669 family integrating conjugative element protein [Methylohalobius crimeensis]|uniref:PFL_4669 family integrating conjugative element protein n=1 Tax=Methylohalobius crimeensis TaxID=244365 RepID=UPI0003B41FC2|nr:TIGR03761 family integrating conjugative element protein [Methylohalobius crimeensis]